MAGTAGAKKLSKGEILFREGDPSDAMFVIKSGRIAITKTKGSGEIVLAELGPGQMLGEMAFFDNKPRSAGARAAGDTEVIILPFKALHAQFKKFPEWLKAMVKTVNDHLRSANQKIKSLEQVQKGEAEVFTPHAMNKLATILNFVAIRFGEKEEEGVVIPSGTLRKYTIQIFQEPTNKMLKFMELLQSLGHAKVEDLGEGRQKITFLANEMLLDFVEYHNDYLFKEESKRVTVEEKEMRVLKAAIHYGNQLTPDGKGHTKVNLTHIQNESMKDLQFLVKVEEFDGLINKGLLGDKMQEDGNIFSQMDIKELERIIPFWQLIYAAKSFK